jgi:hypothetical protein
MTPTPEPATLALMALGFAGILAARKSTFGRKLPRGSRQMAR